MYEFSMPVFRKGIVMAFFPFCFLSETKLQTKCVYKFTVNKHCRIRGSRVMIVTLNENCHHTFRHPAIDCDTGDKGYHIPNSYLIPCSS